MARGDETKTKEPNTLEFIVFWIAPKKVDVCTKRGNGKLQWKSLVKKVWISDGSNGSRSKG